MSLLLACICQIVIVFSIFIVGQSLSMYGTSLPFVPLFSGVCLYVEVYRKNCPNTIGFQFSPNNPLYTSTSLMIRVQRDWNTVTCRYSEAELYKNILQIRSLQKNDQTHENQNISDAADAANRFQRFWATELLKWFIHTRWNYQTIPHTHRASSCLVQGFFILIQQVESWRSSGKDCTSSYQHKRHQYIATTLRLIATNFLHPWFVEQSFSKLLHAAIPQIFLESRCFVSFHAQQPRCRCRPSPEHLGFGGFGPRDAGIFSLRYCQWGGDKCTGGGCRIPFWRSLS